MYLFFRKLLSIYFHIKYKINVINEDNIPDLKGGYIIAANHQKYADPPLIASIIRGKFSFMAKDELFSAVDRDGARPRKTFSMGVGREKWYYIECRKITLA